jgi:hypothetical protein
MCMHPDLFTPTAVARARGCIYSCRVAMMGDDRSDEWCKVCRKERHRPTAGLDSCKLRRDILHTGTPSASSPQTGELSRTRSALAALAAESAGEGAGADAEVADGEGDATEGGVPVRRLTFDDLDESHAPELAILRDANLAIVVLTANALASPSQRGRLLRDALVERGVRRDHFDEIDAVHNHGMGAYNTDIAAVGRVRHALATRLAGRGHARPQRLGYTATLAPSCRPEVLRRAGFARNTNVVRASIDRPELAYARLPIASSDGETLAQLTVRGFLVAREYAPAWAVEGRAVVFATLTANCLRVAALLRARGFAAHAYTSNNMTNIGRALALAAFLANPRAVLVPSEAWGQGVSVPGVTLIVNAGLKSSPVTAAQHGGRAAREAGERGLVVDLLNGRFTAERLRLSDPSKRGATVGPTLLLEQLCARGCMRERQLRYLGGCVDGACAGCDDCARRGAACACLQPIGRLHDLSRWVPAEAAAVRLLTSLSEQGDDLTPLSRVQCSPPSGAPPPFDAPAAHERLVDTLIARGGLRIDEGRPVRAGRPVTVLIGVDHRVKQLLEFGGASLDVLLPEDDAESDDEMGDAATATDEAAARRRAELRAQQFREHFAVGINALHACRELMREHVDDMQQPRDALKATDAQVALVLAATRAPDGSAAASPGRAPRSPVAPTPTIGSVRPPRNLFGRPSPPLPEAASSPAPPEAAYSPRSPKSPRLRRLAALVGGRKREYAGASPLPVLSMSPAVPVPVSDGGGSPVAVPSESRRRPKRRGVLR